MTEAEDLAQQLDQLRKAAGPLVWAWAHWYADACGQETLNPEHANVIRMCYPTWNGKRSEVPDDA